MRTSLSSDPDRGAGYAIIRLETGVAAVPSMPEGCAFSLQRASDALFLAQHGWQESQSSQIPDSIAKQAALLELYVGPHVVDNLDVLDTYRIHLQHTALPASVLQVESLNYSPLKGKQGLATLATAAPLGASRPEPEPEPEAAPQAEPAPEPQPEEATLPLSMATQNMPPQENKKNSLLWIGLALLLLLALGGGYYWYSQQQPQATSPAPETASALPTSSAENDTATSAGKGVEKKPEQPLAQARKHLQSNADAAQTMTLARSLQEQKPADPAMAAQSADAIFLLVEDAAQKGSAEAMLLLGQYFDPADTSPKGSIQPDAKQAIHWYTQARAGGQSEASGKALDTLRAWAEAAAMQGNKTAQEVLSLLPAK